MHTFKMVRVVDDWIDRMDMCPWPSCAGTSGAKPLQRVSLPAGPRKARQQPPLYTPDERRRRDASPWTKVQAILAPIQFGVFLISLYLVLRYLLTGEGLAAATLSIVVKTAILYTIMITGSMWEKDVFGRYLFVPAFFWEDVVSILVLVLHTAYLVALFSGRVDVETQLAIALAAYAAYVINAAQFLLKFRSARLQQEGKPNLPATRVELLNP
jgi:3-vinyl bacteriochlorophyllide hydratase